MSDLKPCPFCGVNAFSERVVGDDRRSDWIATCYSCPAEMEGDTEAEVAAAWNTRATLASEAASQVPADERLDRLEAAIEGELEGLAITRDQAINILVYVDLGLPAAPEQEGPADGK